MIKNKMYRYLGRNGILTTRILIDKADYIPMVRLIADEGKVLTNGERLVYEVTIEESEVAEWKEIADKDN